MNGVPPIARAGAGAEMRNAMGRPVPLFGLFLSLSFRCASKTLRRAADDVCYFRSAE
jgi:hypothetical protein